MVAYKIENISAKISKSNSFVFKCGKLCFPLSFDVKIQPALRWQSGGVSVFQDQHTVTFKHYL